MTGIYKNFDELFRNETEGDSYRIVTIQRESPILIVAPHGGKIEPVTCKIAEALAGTDWSYYCFVGLYGEGEDEESLRVHVTSTRFNEPRLGAMLTTADTVIAIHGADEMEEAFTMVGGLDAPLVTRVVKALRDAGFVVQKPRKGLEGVHKDNIINRGESGAGVQLEFSLMLRQEMRESPELLAKCVNAIRSAVQKRESDAARS